MEECKKKHWWSRDPHKWKYIFSPGVFFADFPLARKCSICHKAQELLPRRNGTFYSDISEEAYKEVLVSIHQQ